MGSRFRFDLGKYEFPTSLLQFSAALDRLQPGDRLHVTVTDPAIQASIIMFVKNLPLYDYRICESGANGCAHIVFTRKRKP